MPLIEPSSHFAHCLDELCSAQGDRGRTHRCASHVLLRVYPTIKLRYFNSLPHEVTKPMLLIWWFAGGRAHGRGVELMYCRPSAAERARLAESHVVDQNNQHIRSVGRRLDLERAGGMAGSCGLPALFAAAPPACAGSVPVRCPLPRAVPRRLPA